MAFKKTIIIIQIYKHLEIDNTHSDNGSNNTNVENINTSNSFELSNIVGRNDDKKINTSEITKDNSIATYKVKNFNNVFQLCNRTINCLIFLEKIGYSSIKFRC